MHLWPARYSQLKLALPPDDDSAGFCKALWSRMYSLRDRAHILGLPSTACCLAPTCELGLAANGVYLTMMHLAVQTSDDLSILHNVSGFPTCDIDVEADKARQSTMNGRDVSHIAPRKCCMGDYKRQERCNTIKRPRSRPRLHHAEVLPYFRDNQAKVRADQSGARMRTSLDGCQTRRHGTHIHHDGQGQGNVGGSAELETPYAGVQGGLSSQARSWYFTPYPKGLSTQLLRRQVHATGCMRRCPYCPPQRHTIQLSFQACMSTHHHHTVAKPPKVFPLTPPPFAFANQPRFLRSSQSICLDYPFLFLFFISFLY
ncbi:uncharacterized protein B0I36DRAFT_11196 [Microdochium trichocladiopsis]|uniref:Uncharacterized protein n=1 Tax=Microdochium trichocladiopsis TaxID=1682393 RepID=A0A9P8YHQ5_9PEZI|nr:uncharacterized protein B0I36DRAFT_11196 [Microdochium trichocladiopsis]KAH7040490.1 hypothetical protein B0I36DRAFT_11196 [Microdochium trichocladiopsis]